ELVEADGNPEFISTLPGAWDGSCSGLQHLALITRGQEEGEFVNLAANITKPNDVYQRVADVVDAMVKADLAKGIPDDDKSEEAEKARKNQRLAKLLLESEGGTISRKLVKRNTMTFSYGATVSGMKDQHREDYIRPIRLKAMEEGRACELLDSKLANS